MHDDFGDDAGGTLVDWMMRVGQEAGAKAASDAADRLMEALRSFRKDCTVTRPEGVGTTEWVGFDMREFQAIEGWDELREVIDAKLKEAGVDHEFFDSPKDERTQLFFRVSDTPRVAEAFKELEVNAEQVKAHALEALEQTKAQGQEKERSRAGKDTKTTAKGIDPRDSEALESKARAARKASIEVERDDRGLYDRTRGHEQVRSR